MSADILKLSVSPEELEDLAIFPLPNGILFPHTTIRLHIFEPRYRRMIEDALHTDMPISVAMIAGTGRSDEFGRPQVHDVAGVGMIIAHEELPGGRYNVLLRGIGRVSIIEEHDAHTPYRKVRARWLDDRVRNRLVAESLLKTIQNCLFNIDSDNTDVVGFLLEAFTEVDSIGAAADILSAVVLSDTLTRQRSLREPDVISRLETILDRLVELIAAGTRESIAGAEQVN